MKRSILPVPSARLHDADGLGLASRRSLRYDRGMRWAGELDRRVASLAGIAAFNLSD